MPNVESVRRALIRHEDGDAAPRSADDLYAQVYSMLYRRKPEELFGNLRPVATTDGTFVVHAHQFVPLYLGTAVGQLVDRLGAAPCTVGWAEAHRAELVVDEDGSEPTRGVLYLFTWGVVVWHVITPHRPGSIAELALWRRDTHRSRRARLAEHLVGLIDGHAPVARYVLTAFWLTEPAWTGRDLTTAMRILTSPRALLGFGDGDIVHAQQVERRLLSEGFAPDDHVPVGVDGVSLGWACWAGVTYHPLTVPAALTESDLATVELLAQGLWCLCDELDQQIQNGDDPRLPEGHDWRWLRGRRAAITRGEANEPQQIRVLRSAVVATSELGDKLTETVHLLREEAP